MATIDIQVQKLFEVVNQKKKEIEKIEKPTWLTNCSFRYDKNSSVNQNLQVLTEVDDMVSILAFLLEKEEYYHIACEKLGVKGTFKWLGFTLDEWHSDIQTRINKIEISKRKKELEILETRLNSLISPELKAQMELEEITKMLEQ